MKAVQLGWLISGCCEADVEQRSSSRQARKTTHSLDGQHQYMDRTPCGRVNQNDRTEINGESKSMVWPTLRSRTAKEQNRTDIRWSPYWVARVLALWLNWVNLDSTILAFFLQLYQNKSFGDEWHKFFMGLHLIQATVSKNWKPFFTHCWTQVIVGCVKSASAFKNHLVKAYSCNLTKTNKESAYVINIQWPHQ